MKKLLANLWWVIMVIVMIVIVYALIPSGTVVPAQKALAATRAALRQQGFKTELADFDFSTSPEMRAREEAFRDTNLGYNPPPLADDLNLMEPTAYNRVIVVWKQPSVKTQLLLGPDNGDDLTWDEFRQAINASQPQIDAACDAIMSGPIQFNLNASAGNAMLLPHLAMLKKLTLTLDDRTMLALHDGDPTAAWTNLLAATRLVTAWQPEPAEISHLVRFANTKLVFAATWQALQTNAWNDHQLARLQQEWTSADFLGDLPETAAFKRASSVKDFDAEPLSASGLFPTGGAFLHEAINNPSDLWRDLRYRWRQNQYFQYGRYEDEKNLLLFYRDREIELRNAVRTPTWAAMRLLPGVTNTILFRSKYASRASVILNLHQTSLAFEIGGISFLGHAAEAETERRIIITAIALERYHTKSGAYPDNLSALAPEFLKVVSLDFMDGQPLRYRLARKEHFILYSVGLDCIDNGGRVSSPDDDDFPWMRVPGSPAPQSDIVWPLPACLSEVNALRRKELAFRQRKTDESEDVQARVQWESTARHQRDADELLATPVPNPEDLNYQGHPLSALLNNSGTNRVTLGQMFTLRQIITGDEPETITFQLPMNYDVVTNLGELFLSVDTNNDNSDNGSRAQQLDLNRAGNGDCLLAWSTLYESPGKHALQAVLELSDPGQDGLEIAGPVIPFVITNLCQFSVGSAYYDPQIGATLHARLPESNGQYKIELNTTNGTLLKTFTGSTSNGIIKLHWDLIDDHGQLFTNDDFNSVFHITLPDSGRSQTLRGP